VGEDLRDEDQNLEKEGTGQKLMGNNSVEGFGATWAVMPMMMMMMKVIVLLAMN
jgi:hypothetical protein